MSHVVELGRRYHVTSPSESWSHRHSSQLSSGALPLLSLRDRRWFITLWFIMWLAAPTAGQGEKGRKRGIGKRTKSWGERGHDLSTRLSVIAVACPVLQCCGGLVQILIDWNEEEVVFFYLFSFSCVTSACFTWQYELFLIIQIWIEIRFAIWKLPMCDGIYFIYLQYRST